MSSEDLGEALQGSEGLTAEWAAEWAALRRRGSHEDFQLEWSVLSWDGETPGKDLLCRCVTL